MKCFLSYRRKDSTPITERIYDHLSVHFGKDNVFKDVNEIRSGTNFHWKLKNALSSSSVVLAIIGKKWSHSFNLNRNQPHDEVDYIQFELEYALTNNIPIIPVLVENTGMPAAHLLPAALAKISKIHAEIVRNDPDFHQDIKKLIFRLTDFIVDDLLKIIEASETENPAKIQMPLPNVPFFQDFSERIQNNSYDTDALLKRGIFSYKNGEIQGGRGYRQAVDDFRKVIGINSSIADAYFGLATVYYQIGLFDIIKKKRFEIKKPGSFIIHEQTQFPMGINYPEIVLHPDIESKSIFSAALNALYTGFLNQQIWFEDKGHRIIFFTEKDIASILLSARSILGIAPPHLKDVKVFESLMSLLPRFDPDAYSSMLVSDKSIK